MRLEKQARQTLWDFGSLPMVSELDPLGNGKPLEAWKEHEQICKLETRKWSSVSREVPYVQLISRICFLVKKCFNSAFQSVRDTLRA